MTCKIIQAKGAVFTVWGKPELEDMNHVLRALSVAARDSGGPIVYVTRVPVDAPAPEPEVRKYLDKLMAQGMQHCSSYHVVLEGTGFTASFKRGVLTGLLQPFWKRRVFFVHAQCEEVLNKLAPDDRGNVSRLLHEASAKGHLSCLAADLAIDESWAEPDAVLAAGRRFSKDVP